MGRPLRAASGEIVYHVLNRAVSPADKVETICPLLGSKILPNLRC